MKIRSVLSLIIVSLILRTTMASQTPFVKIAFEIDGRPEPDREYQLALDIDGKTIEPRILKGGFAVPVEVRTAKDIQMRFFSGKYELVFPSLTKGHFDYEWEIGIKNPPFKEESDGPLVSDGKALKLIYYIRFLPHANEGRIWTTRVYD